MDARRLDFADESFDVGFSLSSFEHFGGPQDVLAAARELGRVLRPGGHAFVVTECFVQRVNVTRTDDRGLHPESGDYWPHVILKADRSLFTSVSLPLRKPI